ncbi:HNH endonuclease [Bradyrhizobium centrolobii]|uniref:HNH endonuclease n=1 Tax=Bradyrhizobium centrolobii TaxID=1505087 RepID=UPI001FD8DABA|nr:HNH endonuclease [Bradyrhizobium centrolobii]
MSRSVDEWIGKTDDDAIPARVRLRVFARHGGICHLSGRRIKAGDVWDLDHVVALTNGGEHRESNLAPALRSKHREKTARDVAEKAKNDRVRKRHLGIKKPRTIRAWRRFDGSPVYAGRDR